MRAWFGQGSAELQVEVLRGVRSGCGNAHSRGDGSEIELGLREVQQVLAATIERAVRYWSGADQATYPEAAKAFHADETAIRKATPVLQKQLQLTDTRNW